MIVIIIFAVTRTLSILCSFDFNNNTWIAITYLPNQIIRNESSKNPYNKSQSRHLNDSFGNFNGFRFALLPCSAAVSFLFTESTNQRTWKCSSVSLLYRTGIDCYYYLFIHWSLGLLPYSHRSSTLSELLINITFPILKSKRIRLGYVLHGQTMFRWPCVISSFFF